MVPPLKVRAEAGGFAPARLYWQRTGSQFRLRPSRLDHQRESIVYIGNSDAIVRERRHQREQQHEASREPNSRRSINFSVTFIAIPYALLEKGPRMTNTAGISGDRICSFIERVERIDEEIKALNEGKKEVFAEAKGEGFDVKVLREILRLRKQDMDKRERTEVPARPVSRSDAERRIVASNGGVAPSRRRTSG